MMEAVLRFCGQPNPDNQLSTLPKFDVRTHIVIRNESIVDLQRSLEKGASPF